MKIQQENHVRTGSISGTTVKSRLNEARMGMILDMLAKKYNQPHTAALREYVSNAYDSHNDAGVTRPVEVTLPTDFAPELIIRDFGLGMSKEEIIDIYSGFGFSTKDNDDTNIGGFGIGSKSALAISNQFSVISVKDGFKNMLVATREDGNIIYKFAVEDAPTDEGNGVIITIPVRRASDYYTDVVVNVLNCWKSSEVFVTNNKEANIRIADKWIETDNGYIDPEIFVSSNHPNRRAGRYSGLAVGPVYYPLPFDVWRLNHDIRMIVDYVVPKLGIGEVKVSSSREVLEKTDSNENAVISKLKNLHEEIGRIFNEKVDACESMKDAVRLNFSYARRISSNKTITFRGETVPTEVPAEGVRSIKISSGSSKSGYMVSIDNRNEKTLPLNSGPMIAIEADESISDAILRRSIHSILLAAKNSKEIPDNANITNVKSAIYGNDFNSLLDIEQVFKATDIVSAGNDLREKPVKGEKKVRRGRDNDMGNRSISVVEYKDDRYYPFTAYQTNLKEVYGKKNVVIFKRDNENELSTIVRSETNNYAKKNFIKTVISNIPEEDRPVLVAVPSNVKSLDPYIAYVEGSVNAGNTWATDRFKEIAAEISKKTNGKSDEIFRSRNAISILIAAREANITGLLDEKVQKFINDTKIMIDVISSTSHEFVSSLTNIKLLKSEDDPMFVLYAGLGKSRYISGSIVSNDKREKAVVEYINREMLDILA